MANNVSAVDLSGLQGVANSHQSAIDEGRSHLQLAASNAQLLSSTWSGDAANQFQRALEDVQNKGNALLNAQQNMHDMTNRTHGNFSVTHENTVTNSGQAMNAVSAAPTGLPGL